MENVGRVVLLAACIEGRGQGATSVRKEVTSHCAERPSTYDPKEKTSVGGVLVNGGLDLQRTMGTDEKDIFKRMWIWCRCSRLQGAVRNT
jgi:hypothetical protein